MNQLLEAASEKENAIGNMCIALLWPQKPTERSFDRFVYLICKPADPECSTFNVGNAVLGISPPLQLKFSNFTMQPDGASRKLAWLSLSTCILSGIRAVPQWATCGTEGDVRYPLDSLHAHQCSHQDGYDSGDILSPSAL